MRNQFETTIKITRGEMCDLLLACTNAEHSANDGGQKWARLHDKIKEQLEELDAVIDQQLK